MDFLIPILNTLALAIVGILLMVGLVEAPWQILLLILVAATLVSQWLIRHSHLQSALKDLENDDAPIASSSQSGHSKDNAVLSYRGASYTQAQPSSDASITPLEMVGKYRGQFWRSGSHF